MVIETSLFSQIPPWAMTKQVQDSEKVSGDYFCTIFVGFKGEKKVILTLFFFTTMTMSCFIVKQET